MQDGEAKSSGSRAACEALCSRCGAEAHDEPGPDALCDECSGRAWHEAHYRYDPEHEIEVSR